jgi:dTDP-4-dehydrorhamnose 3,5-epimerase
MEVTTTPIEGLLVLQPKIWKDDRGYFFESFRADVFSKLNIDVSFVQDNQSLSQKGTIRGLHFQVSPNEQGKLVRVVQGRVLDVVLDIRKNSPTYGQHFAIELNAENQTQFFIPPGFAHGFSTLEDNTIFCYKCTNYYSKADEGGVLFNDPALGIDWKVEGLFVSDKDKELPTFAEFVSPF